MIIVKQKTSKVITAEHRKTAAIGTIDEYGNPFRIIKLRWNKSNLHKNSDYVKTRGFEDAIIGTDHTGDTEIKYRQNGSVMWMRLGGEGPYFGEVAQTPKNMRLLASSFGDKLYTIVDPDINAIVRKMYEEKTRGMDDATKDLNQKKVRSMHTMSVERDDKTGAATQIPDSVEKAAVAEQNRQNLIEKQEIDKRKAELDEKEKALNEKVVDMVGQGVAAVAYTEDFLRGTKGIFKLRNICRELGIGYEHTDKRDDLIKKVLEKQIGDVKAVKADMSEVIGGGLDH
jgi:hypothetical protein